MLPPVRLALLLLLFSWAFSAARAQPAATAIAKLKLPRSELVNVMAGDYVVVGKRPDSEATYTGRLSFRARGQKLAFTRAVVGGRTTRGVATLELTVVGDPAPVLRMTFVQEGRRYGATFQWMVDLDNYPRFTGYVYPLDGTPVRAAGLEMLFPLPPSVRD